MEETLIGYHGTFSEHVDIILTKHFVYNRRIDHWLGQGIYFYKDDEHQARVWAYSKRNSRTEYCSKPIAVIKACIKVSKNNFINMNLRRDAERVAAFARAFLTSSENKLKLDPQNANINRCLLLDYMSHKEGIKVILETFSHIPKSIAELESAVGLELGIKFSEQQICVKDQDVITSKECVYRGKTKRVETKGLSAEIRLTTKKKKPFKGGK